MAAIKSLPRNNSAVAAALESPIPPAFPTDLRRTLGLATEGDQAPQLSPSQELDKLFPTQTEVVVQKLVRIDEQGRKHREPLTVYLEEATIEECAAIARPLQKVADVAEGMPVGKLLHDHFGEAIDAIHAATRVDKEILRTLRTSDLTSLAEAVFEVNAGFFVRRIPLVMVKFQGIVERVLGESRTSSTPSTTPASPNLNS